MLVIYFNSAFRKAWVLSPAYGQCINDDWGMYLMGGEL
jgi:hypothetical protein